MSSFVPWLSASSTSIGGRSRQEDTVVSVPDLNAHIPETVELDRGITRSFFAVFDGHGGSAASLFLAKTFHLALAQNPLLTSDPKAALLDVWNSMDGEIFRSLVEKQRLNNARAAAMGVARTAENEPFPRDGSTATVLLVVGNKLFAANCGDSAGILMKTDGSVRAITKNHDTLDREEFKRIRQLGGFYRDQTLQVPRRWPWCCLLHEVVVGKPRVYPGGLLVTRAFGDFSAKMLALGGMPGVILSDCEEVLELTIEDDWAEVVIASDGVWDVVKAEEMPMILARLEGRRAPGAAAAKRPSGSTCGASSSDKPDARVSDSRCMLGRALRGAPSKEEEEEEELRTHREGTLQQRQAKLQCACAKLILACVRHRYWALNNSAADNASVVVLRFNPPPRSSERTPERSQARSPSPAQHVAV